MIMCIVEQVCDGVVQSGYSRKVQKCNGCYYFGGKCTGCSKKLQNVWGNAEACTLKLYKNVSGIKQARPRSPRHSYPTGKYLAIIKICPAMSQQEPIGSFVLLSDMAMSLRIMGVMLNADDIEYKHNLMIMIEIINWM